MNEPEYKCEKCGEFVSIVKRIVGDGRSMNVCDSCLDEITNAGTELGKYLVKYEPRNGWYRIIPRTKTKRTSKRKKNKRKRK